MSILKHLARAFLDGFIASLVFNLGGSYLMTYLPVLPFGISDAIVLGVLVLVVDFVLVEVAKLK